MLSVFPDVPLHLQRTLTSFLATSSLLSLASSWPWLPSEPLFPYAWSTQPCARSTPALCLIHPSLPLLTTHPHPAPPSTWSAPASQLLYGLHLFPPPGFSWAVLLHQVTATEVVLAHLFVVVSSDVLLGGGFGTWSWAWSLEPNWVWVMLTCLLLCDLDI